MKAQPVSGILPGFISFDKCQNTSGPDKFHFCLMRPETRLFPTELRQQIICSGSRDATGIYSISVMPREGGKVWFLPDSKSPRVELTQHVIFSIKRLHRIPDGFW